MVAAGFGVGADVQETVHLTLEQVFENVTRSNPVINIEKLDIDIATTVLREQLYQYEPRIKVGFGLSEVKDAVGRGTARDFSVLVTESLPTGTQIQARASAQPQSSYLAGQSLTEKYRNTLGITLTQAILRGLNPIVNLAPVSSANLDIAIKREELVGYAQRLIADTERAYRDIHLSKQELQIHEQSLQLAQRLLYESQERLKAGRIAALDLAAIKAEVAHRESMLIDAQTEYTRKKYRLIYLMNRPDLWNTNILTVDTFLTLSAPDSLSHHLFVAKRMRPDLRLARTMEKKGELQVIQTRNGLLPKLDFFMTLQGNSGHESFSDAMDFRESQMTKSLSGGLVLDFPLTSGAARQVYRRAKFGSEQMCHSLENLTRLIEYEVRSAYLEVSRAQKRIEASAVSHQLQQERLEAEEMKLAAGKSTGYMLLQAQRDLISAQLDKARAENTYVSSLLDLYLKDGTLLERRGVDSMR